MRALLALPFLAACVHTPVDCEWPRTCAERRDAVQADARPVAERPVDVSPPASTPDSDHSRDDNGDSSDDNGGKSDD